jgi:serine/threonine protein kinase
VHAIGVIHRDIKGSNIYVTEDGSVQLGDFGVVGTVDHNKSKRTTIVGTPHYMPKEMHITDMSVPSGYGAEVDIWSYGVTVYELATGEVPNQRVNQFDLGGALDQEEPRLVGGNYSDGLRDLIAMCLKNDPYARPTAKEILQHSYLANTSETYPTSKLTALIERYAVWRSKGGQRTSLFNPGGAPAPPTFDELDQAYDDDTDDWNFSTSDTFSRDFTRRHSRMPFGDDGLNFGAPAGSGLPPLNTKDLTPLERIKLDHIDRSASRGEHSLDRLFNPDSAPYDYSTPVDTWPESEPLSDLPLRNLSTSGPSRESTVMIDLDASPSYESAPTFNFDFEDIPTIKAKGRHSVSDDGDAEEADDYQYGDDDGGRRATKDWTFPSMNTATKVAAQPKRATMAWTFATAGPKDPDAEETGMNLPPAGDGGATAPGFRPQLLHTSTVPLGQFGDFLHTTQPQHAPAISMPSSPTRDSMASMIDLDLGLADPAEIVRPTTASSIAESTSSYMTSGNPFDLEDDQEQNNADRNRFSYHKQWQSDGGVSNGNRGSLRDLPMHNRGTSMSQSETERSSQVPAAAEDVFSYDPIHAPVLRKPLHHGMPHPYTEPLPPGYSTWPYFSDADDVPNPGIAAMRIPQLGEPDFPGVNGLQLGGPSRTVPRSVPQSPDSTNGNNNSFPAKPTTTARPRPPFDFPHFSPPHPAVLDEDASDVDIAAELSRLIDECADVFDATGAALRRHAGDGTSSHYNNGSFSMGEESDAGFESSGTFLDTGDEDGF